MNGVTAALADGSTVQFFRGHGASIGDFTAAIAQYDVVKAGGPTAYALTNALDIVVNSDAQATLLDRDQGARSGHRRTCVNSPPAPW